MDMRWVIRVVTDVETADKWRDLIGHLSHMKLLQLHRDTKSGICFDILPPSDQDEEGWCMDFAKYLDGMGINAVCAPRWPDDN